MKNEITRATEDLKKVAKQSDDLLKILTLTSENISKKIHQQSMGC